MLNFEKRNKTTVLKHNHISFFHHNVKAKEYKNAHYLTKATNTKRK